MGGNLRSSIIEQLRRRAASVEQGPVKLSVQTLGLFFFDAHTGCTGPSARPHSLPPACPHLSCFHHDDVLLGEYWTTKCGSLLCSFCSGMGKELRGVLCVRVYFSPFNINCVSFCECGVPPPPPTCMNRTDGFALPCVLLTLEAAALCYQGPRVRVGYILPSNRTGC